MNLEKELSRKLNSSQYAMVSYYIKSAQYSYNSKDFNAMRASLEDAIDILESKGEYSATGKVRNYLQFC